VADGLRLDNGQHILIGAYSETLRLMRTIGVDPSRVMQRRRLELVYPDGTGLALPSGMVHWAFARAVARARGWRWRERAALLRQATVWLLRGMRNPGFGTVDELCAALPARVRDDLIDPLCIAALNTPARQADATVFLRVLADALFGAPGSSDLLLPTAGLSRLFPAPAVDWLAQRHARLQWGQRAMRLERSRGVALWSLDGDAFDAIVLACSAAEAARLVAPTDAAWSQAAAAFRYEPIATVYLRRGDVPLPRPMVALRSSANEPAQFAFDLALLDQHAGVAAFVVSGASAWLEHGLPCLISAIQQQAARALPSSFGATAEVVHAALERRATFACTPGLHRPRHVIAPGLLAAGDYVEGPYPATLEGAVRAGVRAARHAVSSISMVPKPASRMQNLVP
jgi:squalene-associated FAD-dependent desaturase